MVNLSVILPFYNAQDFLAESIASIKEQTYSDFEVICIDDGSTDDSLVTLARAISGDNRFKVISRENKGLIASLNEGISIAKGKYIARMDADDICLKDRFKTQLAVFERSPKCAVVGSSYQYIDINGFFLKSRILPSSNKLICFLMDFGSPLCHPSVMFNRELLAEHLYYDVNSRYCEDYELWLRLRSKGFVFFNVAKPLLKYRLLDSSVSRKYSVEQYESSIRLLEKYCYFVHSYDEACKLFDSPSCFSSFKFFVRILFRGDFFRAIFFIIYAIRRGMS